MKSLRATSRNVLVGVLIAATAVFTFGAVPMAAHAASVGTIGDLQAALSPGTDATVTLSADIWASTEPLVIDRDVTLDLDDHVLFASDITVNEGKTLTIIASQFNRSGTMNIHGTLVLAEDMTMQNYAEVTVGATGRIVSDATPRTLAGMYSIANGGTITTAISPTVEVSGNNSTVRFVDNLADSSWVDVTIYAPTMAAAGIALPDFVRTHATIASWNTMSDASGSAFTEATVLTPGYQWAFAQWAPVGITSIAVTYEGSPDAAPAGDYIDLVVTDTSPGGGADITDLVTFTSSHPKDRISYFGFEVYLAAHLVGDRVVTATLKGFPAVVSSVEVPVTHSGYISDAELKMTPDTVVTGGTSSAYLSAVDEFGNSFARNMIDGLDCNWCWITLSSSDPTDVIDPDTGVIAFTTLGPHTITALIEQGEGGSFEVTAIVNVVAAPVTPTPTPIPVLPKTLAASGSDVSPTPWVAMMLTLLGLGAVLVARRRSRA
ncbi:hypothetical protein ASD65_05840 [Microbacterium sp. Root61]|uniref:hypothetical protein n=1 Tax=Microbacterium sp. Root61 TaxID=1736570 RepID=UPI000701F0B6|nr:hypothetical protein [Microbacterium sp. Root61]KRA23995.1 hypothetical protein ASD65_05840 [Microbacterium sp. Root61]